MNNTPVTPEELTAAVAAISAAVHAQNQRDYPLCALNWDTIGLRNDLNMNFFSILATTTDQAYFATSTEQLNSIYNQNSIKRARRIF